MSSTDGSPYPKKSSLPNSSSTSRRLSASYEETIVHGKKRKVWRSTASNTVNMMSPEAAATYLQQAAEAATATAAVGSGGDSVQISLGPNGIAAHTTSAGGMESLHWMNPSYAAARAAASVSPGMSGAGSGGNNRLSGMGVRMNMSMNMNLSGRHPSAVSFGNLDLAALAKAGDFSSLTSAAARSVATTKGASTASFSTSGFGTSTSVMGSSTPDPRKAIPNMASTASATNHCAAGNSSKGGSGSGKESLPCSEAEMKALMSMFVEIMGMSMDTEKLGKSTAAKKRATIAKKNCEKKNNSSNLFTFGDGKHCVWPDPAISAAAGDFDTLNVHLDAYSDNEDEEDDSLPDLDDMKEIQREQERQQFFRGSKMDSRIKTATSSIPTNVHATPITGLSGIAPVEWESLEQIAIEDAMEAEERARKAAKRREKKNRKKEKARKEAAAKLVNASSKKRDKSILSWRSRVVSACQSNEVEKLKALLEESPLTTNAVVAAIRELDAAPPPAMTMATMTPHLEFFLPHTVARNRAMAERGNEARTMLSHYLMTTNLPLVFTTLLRTGRTALHTACFYGEVDFVEHALDSAQNWTSNGDLVALPSTYLSTACQESGFAPIHYAILSGSKMVLELLLNAGADVRTKSIDTHTWKAGSGKGISPRELAETLSHGSQDKVLETHGLALQEALGHFFCSSDEKRKFKLILCSMVERLRSIEQHGYSSPPPEPEIVVVEEEKDEPEVVESNLSRTMAATKWTNNDDDSDDQEVTALQVSQDSCKTISKKKKKKKKKKRGTEEAGSPAAKDIIESIDKGASASGKPKSAEQVDPLVTALIGMGFTEEQISAAVKACGGTDSATADDLVGLILSEESCESTWVSEPRPEAACVAVVSRCTPASAPTPIMQPVVSGKPKPKEPIAAGVDVRGKEAKAAVKKEEESNLKQQRLAAKREEKIRRNREWNNRAQARQKEEEQARIAQAVAEANRAATQRAGQAAAAQQQQHQHLQLQQAQQQQQQQKLQEQQVQQHSSAAPQQVFAPASAFFPAGVAPSTTVPTLISPPRHAPAAVMSMPSPPQPGHYCGAQMQLPTGPGYDGRGHFKAEVTMSNIMAPASRPAEVQQTSIHHGRTQTNNDKNYNSLPPHPPAGMPIVVPSQIWEPSSIQGTMYSADVSSQYPSIADDSTVSSFGSGRIAASPSFNATIPPGFRPTLTPQTLPPSTEETASATSFEVEENPLGEMRATAKEFVPAFGSRPSSRNAATLRHSTSSLPTVLASQPLMAALEPPATSRLSAFSGADMVTTAPAVSSTIQPNVLLGGINSFGSSFLGSAPGQNVIISLSVTPGMEHLSPVPQSAAFSVTGIPNAVELQHPTGLGLERGSSNVAMTPVIFETTTSGLSSNRFDGNVCAHVPSIWGRISASAHTGNVTRSVAGFPVSGVPSLSLTSGASNASSVVPRAGSLHRETVLRGGLGGGVGWGTSNLGTGDSTTGGSIW